MNKFLLYLVAVFIVFSCETKENSTEVEIIEISETIENPATMAVKKEDEGWIKRHETILGRLNQEAELIWRLENGSLENINPKVALLLIGTNNTDGNHFLTVSTAEELAGGIKKICTILNEKLPDTEILIMGILPYGYKPNHRDNINKATNNIVSKFPEKLPFVHYIDISDVYYDANGKVIKELMPDFLHPNAEGHMLMFEVLNDKIKELMVK